MGILGSISGLAIGALAVFSVEVMGFLVSRDGVEQVYAAAVKRYADMRSCGRQETGRLQLALATVCAWIRGLFITVCLLGPPEARSLRGS